MDSELFVKLRKFNNFSQLKGYKEDNLKIGSPVVVETERGVEFGWIVTKKEIKALRAVANIRLRKVLRYADENDIEKEKTLKQKESESFCAACKKVKEYDLPIKLINMELLFDESKLFIYYKIISAKKTFSSKEIIRDLSAQLNLKIEMHMISPRDEARIISGIGICGRALCCSSFLKDFPHVTVKMLKEQGIPMNQPKVSGICGKLLCCIKYEYGTDQKKDHKQ